MLFLLPCFILERNIQGNQMIYKNVLAAIGNTPIVEVDFGNTKARIGAKLEYLNPGGSVKDRSAIYMIEEAERKGWLKPGGTIIDASSGNQGIAVSMIGAAKGYKVIITVTEKISKEKLMTLKAYGAEVVVCPCVAMDNPHNYHKVALQLQKDTPNSFMPNQYFNLSNRQAHYTLLGPEIWHQTAGTITHFFAAAGTSGTVSGVGRYLKSQNPDITVVAIDAKNSWRSTKGHPQPYAVEGIGVDFDTPVTDYSVIDEFLAISDEHALGILQPLAQQNGLLVGLSSGAVAYAVQQYAPRMKAGDIGVMIFGDSGRAYLSKGFYGCVEDTVPCAVALKKAKELTL